MFLAIWVAGFFQLKYLKKGVKDQVDFLHVDKHQSFLQGDFMLLVKVGRHAQNTQNNKFAIS